VNVRSWSGVYFQKAPRKAAPHCIKISDGLSASRNGNCLLLLLMSFKPLPAASLAN